VDVSHQRTDIHLTAVIAPHRRTSVQETQCHMTEIEHLEIALPHVLVDLVTTVRESHILGVVVAIILVQKHYHPT